MPELPEVEALRRGLVQRIIGSKILKVKVLNEKLVAGKGTTRKASKQKTKEFVENLENKKIVEIKRRAKNLIFVLNTGEIILIHLKMTGQIVFVPYKSEGNFLEMNPQEPRASRLSRVNLLKISETSITSGGHPIEESETKLPHKHTYIIFELDNGTLYYNDVRQFGYVLYFKAPLLTSPLQREEYPGEHFVGLGVEPFDKSFTLKYFREKLKQKSTPIKKLLLDQEVVVGCGNIYCDEVLWASAVLPTRPAKSLKDSEIEKIYKNILRILDKAINSGGSSVANYLLADGKRGNYTDYHKVYKKQNTKCKFPHCTGTIKKISFAGRGTHFCLVHQK